MVKLNFNLLELIAHLPEAEPFYGDGLSCKDELTEQEYLEKNNFGKPLKEIILPWVLDAFFKAMDGCMIKSKADASSSKLRQLIKELAYDTDMYPRLDHWVYDYIVQGKDIKQINQSKKEDNIIKKELAFVDNLMNKLKNPDDKFTWIVSMFLLYEFNASSHFLDAIFSYCYKRTYRFYPVMFSLFIFSKEMNEQDSDAFCIFNNMLCQKWSDYFWENLHEIISNIPKSNANKNTRKNTDDETNNAKSIICCLNELQSIMGERSLQIGHEATNSVIKCWEDIKENLFSFSKDSTYCYYQLIEKQHYNTGVAENLSPSLQEKCAKSELNDLDEAVFESIDEAEEQGQDEQTVDSSGHESAEEIVGNEEELWRYMLNLTEEPLQYNPFSPSIVPELVLTPMCLIDESKENFGCLFRMLQMPIGEINNILHSPIFLQILDMAHLLLSKYSDSLDFDSNFVKEKELKKKEPIIEDEIQNTIKSTLKVFYDLGNRDGRCIEKLLDILPLNEEHEISQFAIKNGYLHLVNRQSKRQWVAIHELFCKVSFGNKSLANKDENLRCFQSSCHGNQSRYCKRRLLKILNALEKVPFQKAIT